MNLSFEEMRPDLAAEVAKWSYPAPLERYGFAHEDSSQCIENLVHPDHRFFAVLDAGTLIAFRSFGEDGQVRGGDYADSTYLDTGGGLRPDLVGCGLGQRVISHGLSFGRDRFGSGRFRVTIADFNQRAQRVCRRMGFRATQSFRRTVDQEPFTVFTIDLDRTAPR